MDDGFRILYYTPIELIEYAGRTAYDSRNKIKEGSAKDFIKRIIKAGHESVLEHSLLSVEFYNVSISFTHQLVRHRLASYTQQSTRYVDKRDSFKFIIPPDIDKDELISLTLPVENSHHVEDIYLTIEEWIELNKQIYSKLRERGYKQDSVKLFLPTGTTTNIVVSANYREWRHIFKLRTAPDAHSEIRKVMKELLKEVKKIIPVIFDDILGGINE